MKITLKQLYYALEKLPNVYEVVGNFCSVDIPQLTTLDPSNQTNIYEPVYIKTIEFRKSENGKEWYLHSIAGVLIGG